MSIMRNRPHVDDDRLVVASVYKSSVADIEVFQIDMMRAELIAVVASLTGRNDADGATVAPAQPQS